MREKEERTRIAILKDCFKQSYFVILVLMFGSLIMTNTYNKSSHTTIKKIKKLDLEDQYWLRIQEEFSQFVQNHSWQLREERSLPPFNRRSFKKEEKINSTIITREWGRKKQNKRERGRGEREEFWKTLSLNLKSILSLNCLFLFPRRRALTSSSSPFSTPSKRDLFFSVEFSSSAILFFFWQKYREERKERERQRQ